MIRLIALLLTLPVAAGAVSCETGTFEGAPYAACVVDPARERIGLYLRDSDGAALGSFSALAAHVAPGELVFAMNAGMFHDDLRPVGLYVAQGRQEMRLVTSAGPGNFGLLPNGVLCLRDDGAEIVESRAFAADPPACRDATQSGPMLVIAGALHPRFLPHSNSRHIRNGVGQRPDGTLVFAISEVPVTFHRFARLFRDRLGAPQALYLDGSVSRMFAPQIGYSGFGFAPLGPMVGVAR